ncbi:hypothetical protein [Moritella viscosa]|uniref:hypothetical protein n=1 Tax=Moritella viscosa TaxID=80854 RepID=UPI00094CD6F3|nr:hypothetical protein [Moritella viscosa]
MMKLLLILTLIMSTQVTLANPISVTESKWFKTDSGVYYKYKAFKYPISRYNPYGSRVDYSLQCFTGYPNNPYTNGSQNHLSLVNNNSISLSEGNEKLCKVHTAMNYNAANPK